MLPFKKVLCPTDFSQHSYEALKVANELALKFGARLYLLHVIAPVPIITATGTPMTAGIGPSEFNVPFYQQELKTSAVRKLRELVKRRIPKKLKVQSIVVHGNAADEIVRTAKKEKIGLIVIATHGETGFRHFIFGSVAEKVVRLAPCPVLTIRSRGSGS
jgi:universal stress protein A